MTRLRLTLALAALAATPTVGFAAFGDADASYGYGGVAPARLPNIGRPAPGPTQPYAARVLSDGGVEVVAPTGNGARLVLSRVRYNSLLARTGLVQAPFGVSAFQPMDSIPYGSGFVTIGQVTRATGNAIVIVRTTSTGALDRTFGSGGVVKLPDVQFSGNAMRLARAPGGYIVAAVDVTSPGSAKVGVKVTRLRSSGILDTSFGRGGAIVIPVPNSLFGHLASLAVGSDSKVVLGITRYSATSGQIDAVIRRLANGAPDTTFDADGVSSVAPAGRVVSIADLVVQPDGKITILATDFSSSPGTPFIFRMTTTGRLDSAFGAAGGYANLVPSGAAGGQGARLIRRGDGRYVAVGSAAIPSGGWISRIDANAQSVMMIGVFDGFRPTAVAAGASRIVAVGSDGAGVVRLVSLMDSDTFASVPHTEIDRPGGVTEGSIRFGRVFPDASGGVFVTTEYESTLRIVALTGAGTPNQTFGPTAGRGAITRGGLVGSGFLTMVGRLRDGRIAVTTTDYPTASHLAILKADGSADTSFQGGDLNLGPATSVSEVVHLPDGRFLLAMGHFGSGLNTWVMRIARLLSDGSYDTTFSGDGIVDLPFPAGRISSTLPPGAIHVHAGAGGYIAVSGSELIAGGSHKAVVARVSTTGVPDPTLGGGSGVTTVGPIGLSVQSARADGLGRTVIVGGYGSRAIAIRLTSALALDRTFSGDGVMTLAAPVGTERFNDVSILPDRSLVLQGLIIPTGGGIGTVDYVSVSAAGTITGRRQTLGTTFDEGAVVGRDGRFLTVSSLISIVPDSAVRRLKGLRPSRPLYGRRVRGGTFRVSVDSRGLTLTTVQIQAQRNGRWVRIGRKAVPALVGRRTLSVVTTRRTSDTRFRAVVVNASGTTIGATFRG